MNELLKYDERFNKPPLAIPADKSWNVYFKGKDKSHLRYKKRCQFCLNKLHGRVLDIGCSDGLGCFLLAQKENVEEVWGVEIQESVIRKAINNLWCQKNCKKVRITKAYSENLPFIDEHFDSIHLGATLEHVYSVEMTIKEAHRVLKKGGLIAISVPLSRHINLQHVRIFSEKTFRKLINPYFKEIDSYKDKSIVFLGKKNV